MRNEESKEGSQKERKELVENGELNVISSSRYFLQANRLYKLRNYGEEFTTSKWSDKMNIDEKINK